ncbi:MAG: hypothetical protein EA409_03775, partial [Saprospirales bacterium]
AQHKCFDKLSTSSKSNKKIKAVKYFAVGFLLGGLPDPFPGYPHRIPRLPAKSLQVLLKILQNLINTPGFEQ